MFTFMIKEIILPILHQKKGYSLQSLNFFNTNEFNLKKTRSFSMLNALYPTEGPKQKGKKKININDLHC